MSRRKNPANCVSALLLFSTGAAFAQDLSPVADIGGHFGLHGPTYSHMIQEKKSAHLWAEGEALFHVLADTDVGWARQDFWWGIVEPERGRFEWEDFDRAVDAYRRHGIKLFAILCYSSAWSDGVCPQTDEERKLFANYVYQMVKRYKGKVAAWEVWNEPNIQPFWSPRPDPQLYAKLLIAAYDAAKRADPDCVVVGGAFAGPDAEFLEGVYAHGAGGHFDVLSYHNYGQQLSIETEWPAVKKLRGVMAAHGEGDKPIWHTENGFYTGPVGVSEEDQGSWIVRYSVGLLALGIEKTFQLTLHDWSDDPKHHNLSSYRGVTHADLRHKPSFDAYRTMCRNLNDKRLAACFRPAPGISGFLFERPAGEMGERVVVYWRDDRGPVESVTLDFDAPLVLVQQIDGDAQVHRNEKGVYELPIGADPVYVSGVGRSIHRQRLVQWPNPVLSRLPRSADAALEVTVENPSDADVWFVCAEGREGPIPPGSRRSIKVKIDLSRESVGLRDVRWALESPPDDGGDALVIAQGFRRIEVEAPLSLAFGALRRLSATSPNLPATIDYRGTKPAEGLVSLRVNGEAMRQPTVVALEPGKRSSVALPIDLSSFDNGKAAKMSLGLESQGLTLSLDCSRPLIACPVAPQEAAIDGDLGEWTSLKPQLTPSMFSWAYVNARENPAPDDLAITGWVAYDARGLWIALRVKDDIVSFAKGRSIWNWDSLQVGLDMGADALPDDSYDANDFQIELAAGHQGQPWCYLGYCPTGWPADELGSRLSGSATLNKEQGIMVYELLIPGSLLVSSTTLEPDTVMGFSLLVNDNDGHGRAGWQELTPGIGMGKRPSEFAWLWLR